MGNVGEPHNLTTIVQGMRDVADPRDALIAPDFVPLQNERVRARDCHGVIRTIWGNGTHTARELTDAAAVDAESSIDVLSFMSHAKRQLIADRSDSARAECTVEIQAAIDSGERIVLPRGQYLTEGALNLRNGTKLIGFGLNATTLKKPHGSGGAHVFDALGTMPKNAMHISGLDIDATHGNAGFYLEYVSDSLFEDIVIRNAPYWPFHLGVINGADPLIRNERNMFQRIVSIGPARTYERLLVFNSRDTYLDLFYFGDGDDDNGIGAYQNVDGLYVSRGVIDGLKVGLYTSLSTRRIQIQHCLIQNTRIGVQGANLSDNGTFGSDRAADVSIVRNRFVGNKDCAVQVGASEEVVISDNVFELQRGPGIMIDKGGIGVSGTPMLERRENAIVIERNRFVDGNVDGLPANNGAAVTFNAIGGDMNVAMCDNIILDTRMKKRQVVPISFIGQFRWTNIHIEGGDLKSYDGAPTISLAENAVVQVTVRDVGGLSRGLPPGVHVLQSAASTGRGGRSQHAAMREFDRTGATAIAVETSFLNWINKFRTPTASE